MGLAEMYNNSPELVIDAPAAVHIEDPNRREIDLGNRMYPDMPKPAGHIAPPEKAAAPTTPVSNVPRETVTSSAAAAPITAEQIEAAVPAEVKAARAADPTRRLYGGNTFSELLSPAAAGSQEALINATVVDLALDHGLVREELATIVSLGRKFEAVPPTEAQRAEWKAIADDPVMPITAEDRAAARVALSRDPYASRILDAWGITEHPIVLRLLARSGRR